MRYDANPIWHDLPADWRDELMACVAEADGLHSKTTKVFFRADDVAVPGRQLQRLLEMFQRYALPLSLAVVPAWLTQSRWQALGRMTKNHPDLWCWHQHGWCHRNHETCGKKQEFGPSRPDAAIAADLTKGQRKLEDIMGDSFFPIFTPPWNRCSEITMALLQKMGYKAVSRSRGGEPSAPPGLPDFAVDVDLHTARHPTAATAWRRLTSQLSESLRRPLCGIMIHHQRMNEAACDYLETLLQALIERRRLKIVDLRDLTT